MVVVVRVVGPPGGWGVVGGGGGGGAHLAGRFMWVRGSSVVAHHDYENLTEWQPKNNVNGNERISKEISFKNTHTTSDTARSRIFF